MRNDVKYCMSSYLQYRTIVDQDCRFAEHISPYFYKDNKERIPVNSAEELDRELRCRVNEALADGTVALMLSSGIDSAILAHYLPKGTQTYTLRCHAESGIDETKEAAYYAKINGLKHTVVDVYWEDFEKFTLPLMRQKGYPIHSIEVQIYKAALQAKKDGVSTLMFGETADIIYGGHSKLLARDWTVDEFAKRFSFVDPRDVLRDPMWIMDPILPYVNGNNLRFESSNVDVFRFLNGFEYRVSLGFYSNACRFGGVCLSVPYAYTVLGNDLDLSRIRNGEGKYVVRELYQQFYPEHPIPEKTPLPRPMTEWLAQWEGPEHPAFYKEHISELSGDQKWYVYALDQFMQYIVEK